MNDLPQPLMHLVDQLPEKNAETAATPSTVMSLASHEESTTTGIIKYEAETVSGSILSPLANLQRRKVAVIGTGCVGLPLSVLLKDCGHEVIGCDKNEERIESLRNGVSFIDDVPHEDLEGIKFSCHAEDTRESDVFIVCVPTPVREDKSPDLSLAQAVQKTLESVAKPGSLIILESTVGVGDTRRLFGGMAGIYLAHSPERIDPSRQHPTLECIPKIVGCLDADHAAKAVDFYQTVFHDVAPVQNCEHSEAVKLLENSYRALNCAFANEFESFCRSSGLDVNDVVDGAATKPHGFAPFRSWIGVGGHCIPVDPHFLMHSSGGTTQSWPILSTAMTAIHERPAKMAARQLQQQNKGTAVRRALVCGVSYKPNVSDARDAPQHAFVQTLQREGAQQVDFCDPMVPEFGGLTKITHLSLEVVEECDAVYVMHKHAMVADLLESFRGMPNVEFFCR